MSGSGMLVVFAAEESWRHARRWSDGARNTALVVLGLAVALPPGFEAQVRPRSKTAEQQSHQQQGKQHNQGQQAWTAQQVMPVAADAMTSWGSGV